MSLFESKERSFSGMKSHTEGDFEYLDRSCRPEAAKVRAFLEEWVARYPIEHKSDLESRLRDRNAQNFLSASFELILFACASSLGYSIDIHPELPNGNLKRPDFLLKKGDNEGFYLEAVLASEFNAADISAQKRKNVILESIDGIESPNFFVAIDAEGNPNTPPSAKKLRHDLQSWLKSLDPDLVASGFDETTLDSLPTFNWKHDGWFVKFSAIPKKPEARGRNQRTIGVQFSGARFVNSWEPIRDAIKDKGGRYGKLERPMLVAVNIDSPSVDRIDEMQALFGEEEFVFYNNCPDPQMNRKPNGAWLGSSGPQYKRVSGAWIFKSLNCWNIASRQPTIYLNPWAERPIPKEFLSLRHAKMEDDTKMKWHDGRAFCDVLGLPINWPE